MDTVWVWVVVGTRQFQVCHCVHVYKSFSSVAIVHLKAEADVLVISEWYKFAYYNSYLSP